MTRLRKALLLSALCGLALGMLAAFRPASEITSTSLRRYGSIVGTGSSDYTISIGNRYTAAQVIAFNRPLHNLTLDSNNYLARFQFTAAVSAASTTVPYRIWLVKKSSATTPDYEFQLLGTGTVTSRASGTGTSATAVFTTAEYPCDTITFTPATVASSPAGIFDALSSAYLTSYTVYSPGSLVPAHVFFSDGANFPIAVFDADPAAGVTVTFAVESGT